MSDKLNILTSNLIRFIAGERPTADKFNAMNQYYSRSIDNICRAIGDMYDRSIDSPLSTNWNSFSNNEGRELNIASLGRLIGPASNLNPKMFGETSEVTQVFSSEDIASRKELELNFKYGNLLFFPAINVKKITNDGAEEIFTFATNFQEGSESTFLLTEDRKRILLHPNLSLENSSELFVTYITIPEDLVHGGINYIGAGWNVIPDPNQENKLTFGSELESLNDNEYSYKLNLTDFEITAQQSGALNLESDIIQDLAEEYNQGKNYKLSVWYEEKFSNGDGTIRELPEGSMYLKDLDSGEIYLTATYGYLNQSEIYIKDANLCEDHNFCLITTGTDITTSIDDLRNKMFNHRHDGSFGEPSIRVSDLIGKFLTGEFGESSIPDNEFPMYLHRKGYMEDSEPRNGNNAMIGNLVLGLSNFNRLDPQNYPVSFSEDNYSTGGSTHRIVLGNLSRSIYGSDTGRIVIRNSGNSNETANRDIYLISKDALLEDQNSKQSTTVTKAEHYSGNSTTMLHGTTQSYALQHIYSGKNNEIVITQDSYANKEIGKSKLGKQIYTNDLEESAPGIKIEFKPNYLLNKSDFYSPTPMSTDLSKAAINNDFQNFSTSTAMLEIYNYSKDDLIYVSNEKFTPIFENFKNERTNVFYMPFCSNNFKFEYFKEIETSNIDFGIWGPNVDDGENLETLIDEGKLASSKQSICFNSNVLNNIESGTEIAKFNQRYHTSVNAYAADSTSNYAIKLNPNSSYAIEADSTDYYFNSHAYVPKTSKQSYNLIDITDLLSVGINDVAASNMILTDQSFSFKLNLWFWLAFIDTDLISFNENFSHAYYDKYLEGNLGIKIVYTDNENRLGKGVGEKHISWLKPFIYGNTIYDETSDSGTRYDYKLDSGLRWGLDAGDDPEISVMSTLNVNANIHRMFLTADDQDTDGTMQEVLNGSKLKALIESGDYKVYITWLPRTKDLPGISVDFVGIFNPALDDSDDIDRTFQLGFSFDGYPGEVEGESYGVVSNFNVNADRTTLEQTGHMKEITNQIKSDWIGSNSQYIVFPRTVNDLQSNEERKWEFNSFQKEVNGRKNYVGTFMMHNQISGLSSVSDENSLLQLKEFIEFPNLILSYLENNPAGEYNFERIDNNYIETHYINRMINSSEDNGILKIISINGREMYSGKKALIDLSALIKIYIYKYSLTERFFHKGLGENIDIRDWNSYRDNYNTDGWSDVHTSAASSGTPDHLKYNKEWFTDKGLIVNTHSTVYVPKDLSVFWDTSVFHNTLMFKMNFNFKVKEYLISENVMFVDIKLYNHFELME